MQLTTEQKISLARLAGYEQIDKGFVFNENGHAIDLITFIADPLGYVNWNDIQLIEDGIIKHGANVDYSTAGEFCFYSIHKEEFNLEGRRASNKIESFLTAALYFCKHLKL